MIGMRANGIPTDMRTRGPPASATIGLPAGAVGELEDASSTQPPIKRNGEGGIRTRGDANATPVFETGPFSRSGTSPTSGCSVTAKPHTGEPSQCPNTTQHDPTRYAPEISPTRASKISSGSLIRPGPTRRHACQPSPGPTNPYPSSRSTATFRCVDG